MFPFSQKIILLVLVAGFTTVSFLFFQTSLNTSNESGESEFAYWQKRVTAIGTARAYEEFKSENLGPSTLENNIHKKTHLFGAVLYESEKTDSISICDSFSGSGCYHEVVQLSIYDNDFSALLKIKDDCENKDGCNHGVGHGIIGYFGYSPAALISALDSCVVYGDTSYRGCYGGVFMGYNVYFRDPSQSSTTTPSARPLSINDPYNPCDRIPEQYRFACFVRQVQLWENTIFKNLSGIENIRSVIGLCSELQNETYKKACLFGIGRNMWPLIQHDVDTMVRACTYTTTQNDFTTCIIGSSKEYRYDTNDFKETLRLCSFIEVASLREECEKEADLPELNIKSSSEIQYPTR